MKAIDAPSLPESLPRGILTTDMLAIQPSDSKTRTSPLPDSDGMILSRRPATDGPPERRIPQTRMVQIKPSEPQGIASNTSRLRPRWSHDIVPEYVMKGQVQCDSCFKKNVLFGYHLPPKKDYCQDCAHTISRQRNMSGWIPFVPSEE